MLCVAISGSVITYGMSAHSGVHVAVVLMIVDRAREALRACLPEPLRDQTFNTLLKVSENWHHSLNVS